MAREHREIVDDITVTDEDQKTYSQLIDLFDEGAPKQVSITMTVGEWGMVLANLRGAMRFSALPAVVKISHERIFEQIPLGLIKEGTL